MSETKTPELDNLLEYYLGEDGTIRHASAMTPTYRRFYNADQVRSAFAAIEARHAEDMRTAIENAKREAYEEIMNDIGCITLGSSDPVHLAGQIQAADIIASGLKRKIEQLREKAGKR